MIELRLKYQKETGTNILREMQYEPSSQDADGVRELHKYIVWLEEQI